MEARTNPLKSVHLSLGEMAVDGLIDGLIASLVMALVLLVVGWILGESPADVLTRFDPGQISPWRGALVHLAVGSVYGIGFGLFGSLPARTGLHLPGLVLGLVYGLVLLAVAELVLLPGMRSPLLAVPLWGMGAAHLVYGATIGWLLGRKTHLP